MKPWFIDYWQQCHEDVVGFITLLLSAVAIAALLPEMYGYPFGVIAMWLVHLLAFRNRHSKKNP